MLVDTRMAKVEVDYRRERLSKSFPKRSHKADAEEVPMSRGRLTSLRARRA